MVIVIIFGILGGYIFYKKFESNDFLGRFFLSVMGIFVGLLVGMAFATLIARIVPHTKNQYESDKIKLVALSGVSSEIEGSFVFASGNIGTNSYYKFYYEVADGGKKLGKIDTENTTIYEEDRTDAYMAKTGSIKKYSKIIQIIIYGFGQPGEQTTYAIHVPKGTIKVEHKASLN